MSRIGNNPINIPQGVTITKEENNTFLVKGKLGEISKSFHPEIEVNIDETSATVSRPSDSKDHKSFHGLTRALLNNMVIGVSEGYKNN